MDTKPDNPSGASDTGSAGDTGIKQQELSGGIAGASGGIESAASGFIDPDTARRTAGGGQSTFAGSIAANTTEPKRGPGRPRKDGSAGGTGPQKEKSVIKGIDKILFSVHAVTAAFFEIPELKLDESEAKELGDAIKQFKAIAELELTPEKAAILNLCTVCGVIYGPRAGAIYLRKQYEKKQRFMQPMQSPIPGAVSGLNGSENNLNNVNLKPQKQDATLPQGFNPTNIKLMN